MFDDGNFTSPLTSIPFQVLSPRGERQRKKGFWLGAGNQSI
jgi:hypothetical protein